MMKKFFSASLMILTCLSLWAQVPASTNVAGAKYPAIYPDNSVEFKIFAPEAHKIQVDLGSKYDMQKDDQGYWYVKTKPQGGGIHYYSMIIDGVAVADPASESFYGCSRMSSCIEIPYADGGEVFEVQDVAHGDIRTKRYFSKVTNSWRTVYVYTPACYDNDLSVRFPVLYIMHGGGEDARGWMQQGRTDIIMDNLIAQKNAVPMLVVSLDANVGGFDNVEKEIMENIVPFVEKNYRSDNRPEKRALAGLSMGGMFTLYTGIPHTDFFHYLGVFSSGWFANTSPFMNTSKERDNNYAYMASHTQDINKNLALFWISQGGPSDIAYENCRIMMQKLKEMGIRYKYYESKDGGHTWPVWREDLLLFAPQLFK